MMIAFISWISTGVIFIIVGYLLKNKPPAKRNHFYGYRSTASKKSQAHWDFAQQYAGNILFNQGIILSALAFLALIIKPYSTISDFAILWIVLGVLFACLIYLLAKTEIALANCFD